MVDTAEATRRLNVKKQTLDDAYAAPANFLEIDILNPITHGVAKKRYTDYEVRMRVSYLTLLSIIIVSGRMYVKCCECNYCLVVYRQTCQCLRSKNPVSVDVTVILNGYVMN